MAALALAPFLLTLSACAAPKPVPLEPSATVSTAPQTVANAPQDGAGAAADLTADPTADPTTDPAAEPSANADVSVSEAKLPSCAQTLAAHRDFDFWVGTWSVRDKTGRLVGHNHIARLPRGCVLVETWRSVRGHTGTSLNYLHPDTKKWHQIWVDFEGGVIQLEGGLQGDAMSLSGTYVEASGKESLLRGIWIPLADGRVNQRFEQSVDAGATWTVWFDGYYTRTSQPREDASGVTTLD